VSWFIRIVQILIFFIAGELLFRFDKATNFFGQSDIVKIKTTLNQSTELNLLNDNKISLSDSILRIMILGDSYIYGGGIDSSKKFSNRLKYLFDSSKGDKTHKNIIILDVSRPSNNTLDNYNTYFTFAKKFKPQIIILGYNINDVEGDLDNKQVSISGKSAILPKKARRNEGTVDKIYNFIFNSVLLKVSLVNINSYLKSHGIIVPNTEFDIELKYYLDNKPQWVKSKALFDDMSADADRNNSIFIVFLMPEMNLLEYPGIFNSADAVLKQYFNTKKNVKFIDGRSVFAGQKTKDLILSRYDGHPNERAHEYLAEYFYKYLQNIQLK
jgi:hypothetical protein